MSTLERAIALAAIAHAGQLDKAGRPYILHVLRVMLRLESTSDQIAGALHDVLEDCPGFTLQRLREEGFAEEVLQALEALTKRPGEDRIAAAHRAAAHPIARRVKLADNADNSDLSRIAHPSQHDLRRAQVYAQVREVLLEAEAKAVISTGRKEQS
jgi:(p)ppGpp synthase/HD superfamily hydrolase